MRGFSDEERDRIRTELLEAGRRLFTQYGLEKTTIADLTDDVGIGTSTFYRFFDSKEALYIAVLEDEGEDVYRRMAAEGFTEIDDPQAAIERFLTFIITEIEANPLARRLVVEPDTRDRLRAQQTETERAADHEQSLAFIRSFIDPFVEDGRIHGEDPELVAEAIAAIPYLTLHREEIGEDRHADVMDFVVETFARGVSKNAA